MYMSLMHACMQVCTYVFIVHTCVYAFMCMHMYIYIYRERERERERESTTSWGLRFWIAMFEKRASRLDETLTFYNTERFVQTRCAFFPIRKRAPRLDETLTFIKVIVSPRRGARF